MANSDQDRPNLFSYATSELSQDAFICWLAAWADLAWKDVDPLLHQTGREFVVSIIRKVKTDYDLAGIKTVQIGRQVGKLDVLIEVNKESSNKLAILVEDKTHTSNHHDQLNRYYEQIKAAGYLENQMIPLYFKTGYQSRFDTLGAFKPYLRSDFLAILQNGQQTGVQNAIFTDFLAHLEQMDYVVKQFSDKAPGVWDYHDWQGFFMVLYDSQQKSETKADGSANWGYIANPSGGLWGYWWYFTELPGKPYIPYLQLEQERLVFKIEMKIEADRQQARNEAHQRIIAAAAQLGLAVDRPERMGNGRWMTVAKMSEEYRCYSNGKLNLDATITNLKKAQDTIDMAFSGEKAS